MKDLDKISEECKKIAIELSEMDPDGALLSLGSDLNALRNAVLETTALQDYVNGYISVQTFDKDGADNTSDQRRKAAEQPLRNWASKLDQLAQRIGSTQSKCELPVKPLIILLSFNGTHLAKIKLELSNDTAYMEWSGSAADISAEDVTAIVDLTSAIRDGPKILGRYPIQSYFWDNHKENIIIPLWTETTQDNKLVYECLIIEYDEPQHEISLSALQLTVDGSQYREEVLFTTGEYTPVGFSDTFYFDPGHIIEESSWEPTITGIGSYAFRPGITYKITKPAYSHRSFPIGAQNHVSLSDFHYVRSTRDISIYDRLIELVRILRQHEY